MSCKRKRDLLDQDTYGSVSNSHEPIDGAFTSGEVSSIDMQPPRRIVYSLTFPSEPAITPSAIAAHLLDQTTQASLRSPSASVILLLVHQCSFPRPPLIDTNHYRLEIAHKRCRQPICLAINICFLTNLLKSLPLPISPSSNKSNTSTFEDKRFMCSLVYPTRYWSHNVEMITVIYVSCQWS